MTTITHDAIDVQRMLKRHEGPRRRFENVLPVNVKIGRKAYVGARYEEDGDERIYLLGDVPASYRRSHFTRYTTGEDLWYVGSYADDEVASNPTYSEYHPLGKWFQLHRIFDSERAVEDTVGQRMQITIEDARLRGDARATAERLRKILSNELGLAAENIFILTSEPNEKGFTLASHGWADSEMDNEDPAEYAELVGEECGDWVELACTQLVVPGGWEMLNSFTAGIYGD